MFHGHNYAASYFTQQAETQVHIDRFRKERLGRWLQHFEALLAANNEGKGYAYDLFVRVNINLYLLFSQP